MNLHYFYKNGLTICSFLFIFQTFAFSQLTVEADELDALYASGESMNFSVQSSTSGTVSWTLKYDDFAPIIASGTLNVTAGQTYQIPHTENEPGVVVCEVMQNGNQAVAAAAFSPYEIVPLTSEPSDLLAFWNSKKAELALVPLNPQVTFHSTSTYATTYSIELGNIEGRTVYGYLSVPTGSGPFPAVITLPPFGVAPNITTPEVDLAEKGGVLSFSVSIHNVPPNQQDPNAYEPDNYDDKDGNYYKFGLMAAARAIDYIFTRSDFDGQNVGVTGLSQGGGLSLLLAGLDARVNLLMYSIPALSQNAGLAFDKAAGFPNYVHKSNIEVGTAAHEAATIDATRYYDALFLARHFEGPALAFLSYKDLVCPLATTFAATNELKTTQPRILMHSIDLAHFSPPEYYQMRLDFLHRFFPSTVNTTPFPWNLNTGYFIDAGTNATATESIPISLSATIENESNVNPAYDLEWSKVEGPGTVTFATPNAYNTTATFSTAGTYVLQFTGIDDANLPSEKEYFYLKDYVEITVQPTNPLPIELISFHSEVVENDILLKWTTANEVNNLGFEIQRSEDGGNHFETISWVDGLGTVAHGSYSFLDKNVKSGWRYYYRLKQIDYPSGQGNPNFSFSPIISERIHLDGFQYQLSPNPAHNRIELSIALEGASEGEFFIFNQFGQIFRRENIFVENIFFEKINLDEFPAGIYFVRINLEQTAPVVLSFSKIED